MSDRDTDMPSPKEMDFLQEAADKDTRAILAAQQIAAHKVLGTDEKGSPSKPGD